MITLRTYRLLVMAICAITALIVIEPARVTISGDDAVPLILPRAADSRPLSATAIAPNWATVPATAVSMPVCLTSSSSNQATIIAHTTTAGAM